MSLLLRSQLLFLLLVTSSPIQEIGQVVGDSQNPSSSLGPIILAASIDPSGSILQAETAALVQVVTDKCSLGIGKMICVTKIPDFESGTEITVMLTSALAGTTIHVRRDLNVQQGFYEDGATSLQNFPIGVTN